MWNKQSQIIFLVLILGFAIILNIGAKSCTNRSNNNTKSGSSNDNTFMINAPSSLTVTVARLNDAVGQVSLSQINLFCLNKRMIFRNE